MTKYFEATIDANTAFYLRTDWLRPMFGHWDCCDPVSHAILDVVEAQRELAEAFEDDSCYACLSSEAANEQIKAAIAKRHAAGKKLMETLENRKSWPDPELGQSVGSDPH